VKPRHPIRLLALDLDGTILGPDLVVTERVRAALAEVRDAGVEVVVATGRMYRSALRYAELLDLIGPLICYQGAYVRGRPQPDGSPGAVLFHRPMSGRVAREAISWSRAHGFDPHLNMDDRLVMEMGDEGAIDYERLSGIGAEFVPDLLRAARRAVTKVLAVGPGGLPQQHLAEARADFEGRAQVTVSHPEYLEWTAPNVHKARALRWLSRQRHVPMAQVMAVGDQFNDLEMLAAVGHGVAMGGAPAEVRAAARYVTASYDSDGAALAMEVLILNRGALD